MVFVCGVRLEGLLWFVYLVVDEVDVFVVDQSQFVL